MVHRRHQRTYRIAAGCAAIALTLAACGSDDSGSGTTTGSTAAPATQAPADTDAPASTDTASSTQAPTDSDAPASTDDADGTDAGMAEAQSRVDAFLKPTTELAIDEPVEIEPGKKLYYVQCSVAVCADIAVGIKAAAETAGWDYETSSHQDTPDTVASAFDAAIAAKPDVVMTSGNPREWFAPQLKTLADAGIPVIAWSMPEGYEPGDGVSVNLLTNDDYYFYGVLMADYAAVNTENKDIKFIGLPTFPVLSTVQQGFEDEIAKACPDCKVDVSEIAVTDIGTNLPGQVVSALQSDPDLDMIVYALSGMLFGVPDALDGAGLMDQAQAIGQAGGAMNFQMIVDGQQQTGEVAIASEMLGWRAVDAAARIMAGQGPGRAETPAAAVLDGHPDVLAGGLPEQILTADTITDPSAVWVGVPGYQDQFKALWGL